jgi:hypothetical protein
MNMSFKGEQRVPGQKEIDDSWAKLGKQVRSDLQGVDAEDLVKAASVKYGNGGLIPASIDSIVGDMMRDYNNTSK